MQSLLKEMRFSGIMFSWFSNQITDDDYPLPTQQGVLLYQEGVRGAGGGEFKVSALSVKLRKPSVNIFFVYVLCRK